MQHSKDTLNIEAIELWLSFCIVGTAFGNERDGHNDLYILVHSYQSTSTSGDWMDACSHGASIRRESAINNKSTERIKSFTGL